MRNDRNLCGSSGLFRYVRLLGLFGVLGISGVLLAQEAAKPTISGFTPQRTMLPQAEPKTEQQVKSFIDSLSVTDGMFEVILKQARLLTLKEDIAVAGKPAPFITVGDPSVIAVQIVGPRHIRILGERVGVTDLSILTADRQSYTFEVQVVADLDLLRARLRETFPDALLKLAQIRDHIVVEGQARDSRQVAQIIKTIKAYLESIKADVETKHTIKDRPGGASADRRAPDAPDAPRGGEGDPLEGEVEPEYEHVDVEAKITKAEVINLIRVPGPQQVMLKVQIAELNRTSLRQLGSSFLFQDGSSGFGSNISKGIPGIPADDTVATFARLLNPLDAASTAFGVFNNGNFNYFLNALRRNQVLKILAEPNLVVMNGHEASFLAGGEFPVPVPQGSGNSTTITIEWKEFGVSLKFRPIIIDGETIRLSVSAEVSSIDEELGIVLQGFQVPALTTRLVNTVVELNENQTLAIAGLLQVEMKGNTDRIPGLGDLPYIGAMFSNNSSETVEKELIVMITPYLVEPMKAEEVPALPGDELQSPDDFELFFLGRIEGRTGHEFRATSSWDRARGPSHRLKLDDTYLAGPHGYSEY